MKQVGSGLSHLAPGDKVILRFNFSGSPSSWELEEMRLYTTWQSLNMKERLGKGENCCVDAEGKQVFAQFLGQSSFSKHAIVPKNCLVKVAPDTDLARFAPMGCGVLTGAGTILNALKVGKGESLAIWGAGAVGMSALLAGALVGASPLIAIDVQQDRLELAKELGATHIINGKSADFVDQIKSITNGSGLKYLSTPLACPSFANGQLRPLA